MVNVVMDILPQWRKGHCRKQTQSSLSLSFPCKFCSMTQEILPPRDSDFPNPCIQVDSGTALIHRTCWKWHFGMWELLLSLWEHRDHAKKLRLWLNRPYGENGPGRMRGMGRERLHGGKPRHASQESAPGILSYKRVILDFPVSTKLP